MSDDPPKIDRRDAALDLGIAATACAATALAAWPAVRFLSPPREHVDARALLGRREEFPPGTVSERRLGARTLFVVADRGGALRAFEARCTHLGCALGYDPTARQITCGCHGGRFALDGTVLAGPPASPLRALTVEAAGEDVFVEEG